ncbi:diguanylate cyclase [Thiohalophilus sp.]|uniref:diguanylate cyclase n=1 Tax=Thiohalophilus sp. TaxID=3028392 RepID=UPI002ACF0943|nr:diguanylate cyclase [Thiohalophilus sp.]MDZ7661642.1 diguanylate cyclase [Thiohalophilus sp.]
MALPTPLAADKADPAPLVISQDHSWPPLAFRDRHGEPRGLLVDLWRALGEQMGRPVAFRLADWPQTIEQVRNGTVPVHGGLFPSPERSKFLDFSHPLIPLETVLFVSADIQARTLDDPALAPVGVVAGSYEREFLQGRYPELPLREYPNNADLVTAAVAGEVTAFAADHPVGRYLLDQYAAPGDFHVLEVLYRQQLVAAVRLEDSALLKKVNEAIANLPDTELDRITQRWAHTSTVEVTPGWLMPTLVAALLVLALIFFSLYLHGLRRQRAELTLQLQERTRELQEQKNQLQALFDNSSVSVMVHDPHTAEVRQANERALEIYGVADVAELNRLSFELRSVWGEPPYSLEDVQRWFERVHKYGPQRFEWLTYNAGGKAMWEDVFLQPMTVGGEERIVSTSIDITAKKQAEEDLQQQLQLEELLRDVSLSLLNNDTDAKHNGICHALESLGEFLQTRRCMLFDYSPENGGLGMHLQWCARGVTPREADFHIPAVVVAPYYQKLLHTDAVIVHAESENRDVLEHTLLVSGGDQSVLVLPILRDGILASVLMFSFAEQQSHWSHNYLKLLQVAAELIGGTRVRQHLFNKLEQQAIHDALTGLYNRRKFEALLSQELERVARYHRALALILFDLDHFKSVNDRFGHNVGDEVLRLLADTLREQLRSSDIPARWGGEEFIVLLPETELDAALQAADHLRQRIADIDFPSAGQITVSLGVSTYQPGDRLESLVKRADDALYKAKEGGRNRVVGSSEF